MSTLLRNRGVMAASLGHMTVDLFNGAMPVLLTSIAVQLGMTNVALGTISTSYYLASSLTQPLFGLVVDRWDHRWHGLLGVGWLVAWYAIAALLPGNLVFAALIIASFGSGAFHPFGTTHARRSAGARVASGTSLFFFFGQFGVALGPALMGWLLGWLPLSTAIGAMVAIMLPVVLLIARLGAPAPVVIESEPVERAHYGGMAWTPLALGAFVLVLLFRGWSPSATNAFLPKWLADAGYVPQQFGMLLSVFLLTQAIGNMAGGWLADRWSKKGVVVLSLMLSSIPFYFLFLAPGIGLRTYLATAAAGLLVGMPHSIMVLMGQNLLPGRMGFASGLMLGAMFTVGALSGWLTGWLGDHIGLSSALALNPALCLIAALFALLLPRARRRTSAVLARGSAD